MKKLILVIFLLSIPVSIFPDNSNNEKKDNYQFIPLAQYDYLFLKEQKVHSASAGMAVSGNSFLITALYTVHLLSKIPAENYPDKFHTVDLLYDSLIGRHQLLGIFKSRSDKPVYGGIKTFQGGLVYGYEFVHKNHLSLIFGAGIAAGDFGIELSGGKNMYVIPVPLARLNYKSKWIAGKFEFLTGPNAEIIIAPEYKIRLKTQCRIDRFRDNRDLIFESSLDYRFFNADDSMGDFAGIAIGVKNDNYGEFNVGGNDRTYECQYYAVFGRIDLSLINVTAGYAFKGREITDGKNKKETGDGFFISAQGMFMF